MRDVFATKNEGGITLEKVKLTKQQASVIKSMPSYTSSGRESLIESHFKQTFKNDWTCINDLSTDDFIKCLYVPDSYEIEKTEQEQINELWKDNEVSSVVVRHYLNGITDTLIALNRQDLIPKDGVK